MVPKYPILNRLIFVTVFIRKELVEDYTESECIRTVAATYSCKSLQRYEYEANEYSYKANCE